jgi:large subunit ribosomal protein LP2
MRYAAAYLLATLAGNSNPDLSAISKILASVGIDCDNARAQKVIDACKGKSADEIIEEGTKKLSSLPAGGGAAVATSAVAAVADADNKKGAAKEAPKKEEKAAKEESDDEDGDMVRTLHIA